MLVKTKNPELYRARIDYLSKREGVDSIGTPQIRTEAFFKSQSAIPVPLTR